MVGWKSSNLVSTLYTDGPLELGGLARDGGWFAGPSCVTLLSVSRVPTHALD